jgi:hypothetical protein
MILALILAYLTVLILLATVLILSFSLVDRNAIIAMLTENLRNNENAFCRAQDLVYKKFNYRLPMSDRYLSIEETLHEKQAKVGD